MSEIAFLDGRFMNIAEARVSIEDRGFQFGDGIYEVIRAYGGKPFAVAQHLARLVSSAQAIDLPLPYAPQEIEATLREAAARSGIGEAVIYIQVTRGVAPRNHLFPESSEPTFVVTVRQAKEHPREVREAGVRVITARDERWGRCDIKSTNLLPNVIAKQKAHKQGAHEAVLVREPGIVTEGASHNFFVVREGKLFTAPTGNLILPGITRGFVIEVAKKAGFPVREEFFSPAFACYADEAFLTGTVGEVLPVTRIDDKVIGPGTPGTITKELARGLEKLRA